MRRSPLPLADALDLRRVALFATLPWLRRLALKRLVRRKRKKW